MFINYKWVKIEIELFVSVSVEILAKILFASEARSEPSRAGRDDFVDWKVVCICLLWCLKGSGVDRSRFWTTSLWHISHRPAKGPFCLYKYIVWALVAFGCVDRSLRDNWSSGAMSCQPLACLVSQRRLCWRNSSAAKNTRERSRAAERLRHTPQSNFRLKSEVTRVMDFSILGSSLSHSIPW